MQIDYREINKKKKFCNKEIIEETSEELNIPESKIEEMLAINAKFYRETIEAGAFESITLPYLGKLKAKLVAVQIAASNIKRS